MAETGGEHRFVATVRPGVGLTPAGGTIEVVLENAAPVRVTAATYGPGDVKTLDGAAITRLVPPPGVTDFEPNLFASVELAHPGLPWALSPARTPLLPWMCLVVVEDAAGVRVDRSGEVPVIVIEAPAVLARELPDLAQTWAWVHAHGTAAAGAKIEAVEFEHSDAPTSARLVCPRRLEPSRRYHAALVPVFANGVRAALGDPPDAAEGALAWTAATTLPLRLPAYRLWSFGTGAGGDFASLARALEPRRLEAGTGVVAVDAAAPGWGIPEVAGRTVDAGGVLRPEGMPAPTPSPAAAALGDAIIEMIDRAAATAPGDTPVMPPPFYGSAPTAVTRSADAPPWMVAHNRDVRLRIAAGAGAAIVRARQEELVASAWQQLGDAEAANQVLRHAELAAAVNQRVHARYVEALPDDELVQAIRPAHRRMRLADTRSAVRPGLTLAADIEDSALPTAAATAAYRRMTRPGGRLARRTGGAARGGEVLARVNRGDIDVAPRREQPDGVAAFDQISIDVHAQPRWNSARAATIATAAEHWRAPTPPPPPDDPDEPGVLRAALRARTHVPGEVAEWTPDLPSETEVPDRPTIDAFALASQAHQRYLVEHLGAIPLPRPRPPLARGRLATIRSRFREAAAPARAVVPVVAARVLGHKVENAQPFRRITITPSFERPLLHDLAAADLASVLPGIAGVLPDTVALLDPDHDAVAAILAGANHELAAELRWRGFPGPERATYLRTFWGRVRREPGGEIVTLPDVPAIDEWPANGPPKTPVGLVLLLRGELVRRYRNAFVYLAEGRWSGSHRTVGTKHSLPLFQARLGDDGALHGFELDRTVVRGSGTAPSGRPGWYVVIEEHPQEPRFGLAAGAAAPLRTWRDLGWAHVEASDLPGGTHLVLNGPLAGRRPTDADNLAWGLDAAQQAAITLRRPTRVAIHASLLVNPG